MDSNSCSVQSSSGGAGDEESYDSRTIIHHQNPFLSQQHLLVTLPPSASSSSSYAATGPTTIISTMPNAYNNHFDRFSNYFIDPRSTSANHTDAALHPHDAHLWPTPFRPDPSDLLTTAMMSSSSTRHLTLQQQLNDTRPATSESVFPTSTDTTAIAAALGSGRDQNTNDSNNNNNNNNNNPPSRVRPKKRSRASRRAPTTVLTTDTTNFRAMVQEFTGIPAPPFAAPSSALLFPSRSGRFDLFGGSSPALTRQEPSSYLLRPFAHRPRPPLQQLSNSAVADVSNNAGFCDSAHLPINSCSPDFSTFTSLLQTGPPLPSHHQQQKYVGSNEETGMQFRSNEGSSGGGGLDEFIGQHAVNKQQQEEAHWSYNSNNASARIEGSNNPASVQVDVDGEQVSRFGGGGSGTEISNVGGGMVPWIIPTSSD